MKKIARIFITKTRATPTDDLAFYGPPPMIFPPVVDEVHISVTFTWDLKFVDTLVKQWSYVAPVKVGGPALGVPSGEFFPGMYVGDGYTVTSRGCPNKCWFCSVWKREGVGVRELEIKDGCNILDDNLLACSDAHVNKVFDMLQNKKNIEFTGGLEAKILKEWHIKRMMQLRIGQLFFAYDTPDDLTHLRNAGKMFSDLGAFQTSHKLRCYVLCGWPKDSFDKAEARMREAVLAGFMPMAMVYRDFDGKKPLDWARWQRRFARPAITNSFVKEVLLNK